ncbi:MAG: ATP-binding cassette domain-containing protein, partial [Flavobacteriales bacterium]|nr:ATP-binding cassette domain-containing protein [Flavobacteriales bacterium]
MEKIIDLNNATIKQDANVVLSNVTCHVQEAEFVYLMGKTGSGKSSLLKTIYGDLKLFEGEGTVAGYDLNKLKKKEIPFLRRKMGIVFQDFQLLMDRTVLQNMYFVLKATGWKNRTEIHS